MAAFNLIIGLACLASAIQNRQQYPKLSLLNLFFASGNLTHAFLSFAR